MKPFSDFENWEAAAHWYRQALEAAENFYKDKTWWERHLGIARDSARRGWAKVRELRESAEKLMTLYKDLQEINRDQVLTIKDRGKTIEALEGALTISRAMTDAHVRERKLTYPVEFVNQLHDEIENLRRYITRQHKAHKIELEGQRGGYLMAIDEIGKLRNLLGQRLVNEAEELFEKTREGTDTPGPGGEYRRSHG